MKVLFSVKIFHTNYNPKIKGLLDKGYNVAFLSLFNGFEKNINCRLEKYNVVPSFTFSKKTASILNLPNIFRKVPSFSNLNYVISDFNPDIIVVRDLYPVNYLLILIAKAKSIPLIYYDQAPPFKIDKRFEFYKRKSDSFFNRFLKWFLLNGVPRFTTTFGNLKYEHLEYQKSTYFIPFSVIPPNIDNIPEQIEAQKTLRIFSITKLDVEWKNTISLVQCLKDGIKNGLIHLTIYGTLKDTDSYIYKNILKVVEDVNSSNLKIEPNVPYEECLKEYQFQDLFILPSRREPAAFSPFEALSNGLPVILADDGGTSYIVTNGFNGFQFKSNDFEDLKKKVQFFIENPSELSKMGINGKNMISNSYLPEHFATRFEYLLQKEFNVNSLGKYE